MEIKKRVGIKYCGGCNPSYERVELINRVRNQFGNHFIFLHYGELNIDLLIFISGCLRNCAFVESNSMGLPYFSVIQEGDFENLISFLKSHKEKGVSYES